MATNWGECYSDHYARYLGAPTSRGHYEQADHLPDIQCLHFEDIFPGCWACCSVGLASYPEQVGGPLEVILVADEEIDLCSFVLLGALTYAVQHGITLQRGARMTGLERIDAEFAARYAKTSLYFTEQYVLPDEFDEIACGNERGTILQAIFLSQAEYAFAATGGIDALESHFEANEIDLLALARPSSL